MENGPFIDDFPIKTSIYKWFSMAMLNNQRVYSQTNGNKTCGFNYPKKVTLFEKKQIFWGIYPSSPLSPILSCKYLQQTSQKDRKLYNSY